MGLLDGNRSNALFNPYIEGYGTVENHLLSSTDDESDSQSINTNFQRRVRPQPSRRHPVSISQENLAVSGRRKGGVRRTRRIDNLKYLINLQEKDDEVLEDNNFANYEPGSSMFGKLFEDSEKMEAWTAFVESSEEEQQRMLNYRGLHDIQEETEDESEEGAALQGSEGDWVMILDQRSDHPAFTPKECYARVDKKLKTLLKRRQLPLGMLANLERELVTFFHGSPSAVFLCDISSSYERLLLHALCQYLKLHSYSYDDESNSSRKTQVENRYAQFQPPSLLLSEYLQLNQRSL